MSLLTIEQNLSMAEDPSFFCGHFFLSALGFPEFSGILEAASFSALFLHATGSLVTPSS